MFEENGVGWTESRIQTIVMDITPGVNRIIAGMRRSYRKSFRKAGQADTEVRINDDTSYIDIALELQKNHAGA